MDPNLPQEYEVEIPLCLDQLVFIASYETGRKKAGTSYPHPHPPQEEAYAAHDEKIFGAVSRWLRRLPKLVLCHLFVLRRDI